MQIKLIFKPDEPLAIPLNYNYQLQSAVYAKLSEIGVSDFWHNNGFGDTETFKFFVFSPLLGNYIIEDKKIVFTDTLSLEIRSPFFDFCDDLQRSFELKPSIKLFDTDLTVSGAFLTNQHINEEYACFRTVSPIVLYTRDAYDKMHFISPASSQFVDRLHENFYKKYKTAFDTQPPEIEIRVTEIGKKIVTKYKEVWLTGYNCNLNITAPSEALEFIYNCGLGERNSQGFGLVKLL